jgi:formyltetrahydrofolate deformylase
VSRIRLLVACADRPGIVAAVSAFLFDHDANIVDSAQHTTDADVGTFFMRMEFDLEEPPADRAAFERSFEDGVAQRFGMDWRFDYGERKRVAILVSRHDHCLLDLLWRWRRGELGAEIVRVVSNHPDLEADVRAFGIPYTHVPVEKDRKFEAETKMLAVLPPGEVHFLILARYMQILSADFLARVSVPVINIHHSFLPAFVGADPYRHALDRGVKIIGATAHYVTEELDAGPIIEQDVARVSHRHDLAELERIGRDIERVVLARAVRWHVEDRVIVHGNKTFVFD